LLYVDDLTVQERGFNVESAFYDSRGLLSSIYGPGNVRDGDGLEVRRVD
jgi:hypothetical protein